MADDAGPSPNDGDQLIDDDANRITPSRFVFTYRWQRSGPGFFQVGEMGRDRASLVDSDFDA